MQDYEKWNEYDGTNPSEVPFVKATKDFLHRKVFVDDVINSPDIHSIIEVGPGAMIEYPIIKTRSENPLAPKNIDYTVVDVSDVFLKNCKEKYPEVHRIQSNIENFHVAERYDLIYAASVLAHTYNVQLAIKNIIRSARRFCIVMFKWSYDAPYLIPQQCQSSKTKTEYWSTTYNIWRIFFEIARYGIIESATLYSEKNCVIDFYQFVDRMTGKLEGRHRTRDRLVISGSCHA